MTFKKFSQGAGACAVVVALATLTPVDMPFSAFPLGASQAKADVGDRGVARRTARRTTRRVERRHDAVTSLPTGCTTVIVNGASYWRCGSVYYQSRVDSGDTVYVIVNP